MGKEPLDCPRHRWEDNIKMEFQEIYWWEVWTGLMKLRLGTGGACGCSECCDEPLGFVKCG
jgi:hypothetical protein